jgi:hypothetical protein
MVDIITFKERIQNILTQRSKIDFYGDDFEKIVMMFSEIQANELYSWVEKIIKKEIQPILPRKSNKNYKQWPINDLIVFLRKFNISNTEYRIILLKVKNKDYIEFNLGKHDYYDSLRYSLGLTDRKY